MDTNDTQVEDTQEEEADAETSEAPIVEERKEKAPETPEAKKARLERQLKQVKKQLGEKDEADAPTSTKQTDLDYGQLAFLKAHGISTREGDGELTLIRELMANTGKSLKDLMESKYFNAELNEFRETKASREAIPTSSKRSVATSPSNVEYWLAKGELPPNTPDNQNLRREVVNARLKAETEGSKFSTTPVVR